MSILVSHILVLICVISGVNGQIVYRDAPLTQTSSCEVSCCLGCLNEKIIPTSKTVRKCTTKTRTENYMARCGYMGTSQCNRQKTATYEDCASVSVTYNKIEITCRSGCTCMDRNVLSPLEIV